MYTLINITYVFFIFVIFARFILSLSGTEYGKFYNFCHKYSEFILKPARMMLSFKYVSYAPFLAIIGLGIFKDILYLTIRFLPQGELGLLAIGILLSLLFTIKGIVLFFIIVVVIKSFMGFFSFGYSPIYSVIDSLAEMPKSMVRKQLSGNFVKYTALITVILLYIINMGLERVIRAVQQSF